MSRRNECLSFTYVFDHIIAPNLDGYKSCDPFIINNIESNSAFICRGINGMALFFRMIGSDETYKCSKYSNNSWTLCSVQPNCGEKFLSVCSSKIRANIQLNKSSRKVISYSLYDWKTQRSRSYFLGLKENIRLAKIWYPEWITRVYVNASISDDYIKEIEDDAQIIRISKYDQLRDGGAFWRFLVADDPSVDYYLIRDTDSRLEYRSSLVVEDWIESGKGFHTMRDHIYHELHVQAGMWGGRKRIDGIRKMILEFKILTKYGDDQKFLNQIIWPKINMDVAQYDSVHCNDGYNRKYPIKRMGDIFVGDVYTEYNEGFFKERFCSSHLSDNNYCET